MTQSQSLCWLISAPASGRWRLYCAFLLLYACFYLPSHSCLAADTTGNAGMGPSVGDLESEPGLSINSTNMIEPWIGTNFLSFSITLSRTAAVSASVSYYTIGGTALPGEDFLPITGTVVFTPGETNRFIRVPVLADFLSEPTETLFVVLTNSVNSLITVSNGTGFILDTPQRSRFSYGRTFEPIGPSSPMTDLVISEIMYNPPGHFRGASGKDLDFIELYNAGPFPANIGGYQLGGDISLVFPENTIIQPGSYLVVPDKPSTFSAVYGISTSLNFGGSLSDGGGSVLLRNRTGAILLEVHYNNKPPWPALANGRGHSLVLARPSFGEGDPRAWDVSERDGGSPGSAETPVNNPLHSVVINEVLANSVLPDLDFIELYNKGTQDVDISSCSLSDSPDTNKLIFVGAVIPAGGYLALDEVSLGFKLKAEGDTVYFRGPDGETIDALHYEPQHAGISVGRFPEGGDKLFPLFPPSPFDRNDALFTGDVVINEIMYAPISGDSREAYIELHNRTTNAVNVGGWQFIEGINFIVPPGAIIPPQGFLVIARDTVYMQTRYPQLNSANTVGNFTGNLATNRSRYVLVSPEPILQPGITNTLFVMEDEVNFDPLGRGKWSRAGGSSLELRYPGSENNFAANWSDSDEDEKSTWVTIQADTDLVRSSYTNTSELQIMLQGPGECLVDDVEVFRAGENNLLSNGSFEAGLSGWVSGGNHVRSSAGAEGTLPGQHSLHLRASGAGDTALNNVRAIIPAVLTSGQISIRARARWLRGNPVLVLRLAGQAWEASSTFVIPPNCGTPGLSNTQKSSKPAPVIPDVQIHPILPAAGQPITVTAQVQDANEIVTMTVYYRLDPGTNFAQVTMVDDGTGKDAVAGDGLYTASIPGQSQGALIAFYVEATNAAFGSSRWPSDAPARECLLRFGEVPISGNFEGIKTWMTSSNLALLNGRPRSSDEPVDCTVVYRNSRIIFNAGIRFAPNPADSTNIVSAQNGIGPYLLSFPPGEKLLGTEQWMLEPISQEMDPSLLRRTTVRWMAEQLNVVVGFERFMRLAINGVNQSSASVPLFVARRAPVRAFANAWFPDSPDGELFEIKSQVELSTTSDQIQYARDATLEDTGTPVVPRQGGLYRWNWRKEQRWGADNDYPHLLGLADAFNAPSNTFENIVDGTINTDQWILSMAFRRGMGDPSGYGYKAGRNAFIYKPPGRKWLMIPGVFVTSLGALESASPTEDVYGCLPSEIDRFLNQPAFNRKYLRALGSVATHALDPGRVRSEILDFGAEVLEANGLNSDPASRGELLTWITARRDFLNGLMPALELYLVSPTNIVSSSNSILVQGIASPQIEEIYFTNFHPRVTWTTPTNWTAEILVAPGSSYLVEVSGRTSDGIYSPRQSFSVSNSSPATPVSGTLVISEISYSPANEHGSYIELYNPSEITMDVSSCSLLEFGFVFPIPFYVPPRGFVLVVEDQSAFTGAFGVGIPIAGELGRALNPAGETITLLSPLGIEWSKVQYGITPPWPSLGGTRQTLHLLDPRADSSRVGNWVAGSPTPGQGSFITYGPFPLVCINELQPSNIGIARDNAGEMDPWVELYNPSMTNVTFGGAFYLTDDYSNLTKWQFPTNFVMSPQSLALVWADGQPEQNTSSSLHTSFRLKQAAGPLALVQSTSSGVRIVDYINVPLLAQGRSYGSYPNGQLVGREIQTIPTPGGLNQPPPILINEWMASNGGIAIDPADNIPDDWFELYNGSSEPRNIRGYKLSDSTHTGTPYQIPFNRFIPPHGCLLIWADGQTNENTISGTNLHIPWSLSAKGDSIKLFAPDGMLIDSVSFGRQTINIAQGRFPDGAANILLFALPTPGSSNRLSNLTPPTIAPIPNRVVTVGQTLSFPVQATDSDTPMSFFSYGLGPGAPDGATMQGSNFVWLPSPSQAPGTNLITLLVVDNGAPPLVGAQTFQAIVTLPPQPHFGRNSPGGFALSFDAWPGKRYEIQYKNRLQDLAWTPLTVITNNNNAVVVPFNPATNAQRFFRVGVLD